jgi:YfiH family protein
MSSFLSPDWPAPANIRACTTLRTGPGVSPPPFDLFNLGLRSGDEPANALENRRKLHEEFGLPREPAWLQQVHGVDVIRIDRDKPESAGAAEPIADASVTSTVCTVLAILTADCLPVLFCNEQGDEVAAAHAGWRGLAAGVLEATVGAMATPPRDLMAWLGPAAGPEAYEVGDEVREAFVNGGGARGDGAASDAFVATRPGHWRVDLYALARLRLADAGIRPERVFGGDLCTISDPARFYSHRRDQRTGRMASLIWFAP